MTETAQTAHASPTRAGAAAYARPAACQLPGPTAESRAFRTGGRDGKLLISRCRGCGRFLHPPRPVCWRCGGPKSAPRAASGRTTVPPSLSTAVPYSRSPAAVHGRHGGARRRAGPFRLVTNVVGAAPEEIRGGAGGRGVLREEVEVFFEKWKREDASVDDRVWLPCSDQHQRRTVVGRPATRSGLSARGLRAAVGRGRQAAGPGQP